MEQLTAVEIRRLREILDKDEIRDLMSRYCRGVDRCDAELIASVYHADAIDEHGPWRGLGVDFASYVVDVIRGSYDIGQHVIGNMLIEICGDVAAVETYFFSPREWSDADGAVFAVVGGRYLDRFERRDGRWAIAHRRVVQDWSSVQLDSPPFPGRDKFPRGRQGTADPLYAFVAASS